MYTDAVRIFRSLAFAAIVCTAVIAQSPHAPSRLTVSGHVDHVDAAGREPMVVEAPDGSLFVAAYGDPPRPVLWKSSDHGATWKRVDVGAEREGAIGNSDVALAVAHDGTLYFANLLFDRDMNEGREVSVGVSPDGARLGTGAWSPRSDLQTAHGSAWLRMGLRTLSGVTKRGCTTLSAAIGVSIGRKRDGFSRLAVRAIWQSGHVENSLCESRPPMLAG